MNWSEVLLLIAKIIYTVCMLALTVYGLYALSLAGYFFFGKKPSKPQPLDLKSPDLPYVTIQLPTYNECEVVTRLIKKVMQIEYPKNRLQIQVLDDSTDGSIEEIKKLESEYCKQGWDFQVIHRENRSGFKAGALQEGMKSAKGEFIGIFDADFLPPSDWLKRTLPAFDDPKVGCVQTRWGHVDVNYNGLTRTAAMILNGHFVIEQAARSNNGLFMGFNGTAGIWRKACIEDAGGWQTDTLTEDLDLSYRAQLRGWKIRYLPDVVVPAELPITLEAFKQQQSRWAKGGIQTARKLYPKLIRADIPLNVRLMGLIHLGGYMTFPLGLIAFIMLVPVAFFSPGFLKFFPYTVVASLGAPLIYMAANGEDFPRLIDRIKMLPMLLIVGSGLAVNNSIAVLQGLFSRKVGTFTRTQKFNVLGDSKEKKKKINQIKIRPIIFFEILMFGYAAFGIYLLFSPQDWEAIPWISLYTLGFGYMGFADLWQTVSTHNK